MRRLYPTESKLRAGPALEAEYELPSIRHVRANFVSSLDGGIEIDGRSAPLAGPADRDAYLTMRAVADVILVGAGTVRAEKYGPVRLNASVQERRLARNQAALPPIAVVSNRGALDPQARLFNGDVKPILITAGAAQPNPDMAAVADVLVCGDQSVDLGIALDKLAARGLRRVLCEGGPTLFHSLIVAGLLDELCLTLSAQLIGPGHRDVLGDAPLPDVVCLELTRLLEGDGMLLTRYRVRHRS
jgi:riboflavin biosynthesis pyrimidine reductase